MKYDLVVYTKEDCPYCNNLKNFLNEHKDKFNIKFIEVNDREERNNLYEKWRLYEDKATFPQMFYNSKNGVLEHIGDSFQSIEFLTTLIK